MSEEIKNTLTAYLGHDFQQKLMWQLLVEPEFAENVLPQLSVEYFDDPNLRRLFIICLEYFSEFEKVPNLPNKSIYQAITKYGNTSNIESQVLNSIVEKIKLWNDRVLNGSQLYDGDIIRSETFTFIRQQEYRKLAELINKKTKTGEIRDKKFLGDIDILVNKISNIGLKEDYGTPVDEDIEKALRREFRQTIPTGILAIDEVTGGGLGRAEIGLILAASGVGKTTILTRIANTAYEDGKHVLQVTFEDSEDQIKRKHYTIWSKIRLSELDERREDAIQLVKNHVENHKESNKLVIKRFSQDGTTLTDIKNWMIRYEKKYGISFDILVLDYLDCLEPHRRVKDPLEGELVIIKGFEAMAADLNIPMWSATQSNRSGFNAEFLDEQNMGGSIKKVQKSHFVMSIAKTKDQKEAQQANIRILKARFAQDGQTFENCIFNNDTMEIRITDSKYYRRKKLTVVENLEEINQEEPKTVVNQGILSEKLAEVSGDNSPTIADIVSGETNNVDNINTEEDIKPIEKKIIDAEKLAPEPTNKSEKLTELTNINTNGTKNVTNDQKSMILKHLQEMREKQGIVKKD